VDCTEENLQARCRGTLLMAISNRTGKIVLATEIKVKCLSVIQLYMVIWLAAFFFFFFGFFYVVLKMYQKTMVYR